ncbi:hypothetical protein CDG81_22130 [Actinopolyspora erythraea]|uniref:Secreted protein n=1 Tax=Actinopolyspora erythraea TaxID=414996 RepID=A0A099D9E8_9ACTN|nr:hypothetical protein [Actinopolyspora erythraea]ASU80525.1 hypothetical protein CDG81_22130 [Actinopolyspora erythraea]KGI82803.1 hypothetical protein IL38_02715 [Actinopolyspora erythraea]
MVDLAMVALVLVALLAVWLFLRGADRAGERRAAGFARYRNHLGNPSPDERRTTTDTEPPGTSGASHGPGAYRSMLSLRRKQSGTGGGDQPPP